MTPTGQRPAPKLSVRRSLAFSFAQRYTNLLMSVPTIIIVSRLLTPAQVGVFSLGMAVTGLIHSLRDFGVSDYLVQVRDVNDGVAQTAFTINVIIAWTLGVLVFLSAGYVADFYSEPGLADLLKIFCLNFLLLPFGTTTYALLKRSMQFNLIYKINVLQQMTQSVLTVALAYLGFGYLGLGIASAASIVVLAVASVTIGREYRIKGISLTNWREVASFGSQRTTTDIVSRVAASTPDFVLARVMDFTAVGLFSRGKGLVNMFDQNILTAIKSVTFPSYAGDFRDKRNAGQSYLLSKEFTSVISLPFLGFAIILAYPIMRAMFGPQWDAAVPIMQVLAFAAMIGSVNSDGPEFLIAAGRVGLVTRITLFVQLLRIPLVIAAAFYSLVAVASVQLLVTVTSLLLVQTSVMRNSSVSVASLLRALSKSAVVTLCSLIGPVVLAVFGPFDEDAVWMPLVVASSAALLGWLIGIVITGHPVRGEIANALSTVGRRLYAGRSAP